MKTDNAFAATARVVTASVAGWVIIQLAAVVVGSNILHALLVKPHAARQ